MNFYFTPTMNERENYGIIIYCNSLFSKNFTRSLSLCSNALFLKRIFSSIQMVTHRKTNKDNSNDKSKIIFIFLWSLSLILSVLSLKLCLMRWKYVFTKCFCYFFHLICLIGLWCNIIIIQWSFIRQRFTSLSIDIDMLMRGRNETLNSIECFHLKIFQWVLPPISNHHTWILEKYLSKYIHVVWKLKSDASEKVWWDAKE